MKLADLVKPAVLDQPVYVPGRPLELVAREIGLDPEKVWKLASNENLFGPSPKGMAAAREAAAHLHYYPENDAFFLREKLAARHGLGANQFVFGCGSVQVIEMLGHLLIQPGAEVVFGAESFIAYKLITLLFGGTPVEVPMPGHTHDLAAMREAVTDKTRLVFLPSPSNPTGTANDPAEVFAFARELPEHVVFCFDEAYCEYLDAPADLRPLIAEGRPVICTRTFSKMYGLAGLRVGYGYTTPELAGLLNRVRLPFNINGVAQAAALAALDDDDFVARCREQNASGLRQLQEGFARLGLDYAPSQANFVMVRVPEAARVCEALTRAGLIVRPLGPFGLTEHLRITVGPAEANAKLLETLEASL